jgi:EAL domain-containing protein (putative c-di-GMP-specific phosphodiesterase class I)
MVNVDKYIINKVFEFISQNTDNQHSYSINLSGNSLNDENISNYIKNQIREYQIDPQFLCFEITETAAITNVYKTRKLMFELRELGCRFSLDDFGSGLSSFEYLKNLPVDFLKIDGSFVRDMVDNKTDHAMVAAINEIGHVMGISTIAEFVENDKIIHKLRQIGVDYAQGFGIHRPCSLEEITESQLIELNQSVAGYV